MNVRFAEREIRFRLDEGELRQLQNGDGVTLGVTVAGRPLRFAVTPRPIEAPFELAFEGGEITLTLSPQMVNELASRGRTREGLVIEQGALTLALQVDLKPRRKAVV